MFNWFTGIAATAVLGFITFIAAGVMEAKTLESRVNKLEVKSVEVDRELSDFKSNIKGDIGHIKGQNDIIIKMLQQHRSEK
jgi:hypothetical protein